MYKEREREIERDDGDGYADDADGADGAANDDDVADDDAGRKNRNC